jgi:hypothetical protein
LTEIPVATAACPTARVLHYDRFSQKPSHRRHEIMAHTTKAREPHQLREEYSLDKQRRPDRGADDEPKGRDDGPERGDEEGDTMGDYAEDEGEEGCAGTNLVEKFVGQMKKGRGSR